MVTKGREGSAEVFEELAQLRAQCSLLAERAKEAQQRLDRQSNDHLASLGALAARLAHDINNPLALTVANLDVALADLDGRPVNRAELRVALLDARAGALQVGAIIEAVALMGRGRPMPTSAGGLDGASAPGPALAVPRLESALGAASPGEGARGAHAPAGGDPARIASPPAVAVKPRRARVLVIDDEPMVTTALRRLLGRDYELDVSNDSVLALSCLEGTNDYAIVLCDMMMPGLTGAELYAAIARSRPELLERFVFMTGGASTDEARAFLDTCHRPVLDKPFDLFVLEQQIAACAAHH